MASIVTDLLRLLHVFFAWGIGQDIIWQESMWEIKQHPDFFLSTEPRACDKGQAFRVSWEAAK